MRLEIFQTAISDLVDGYKFYESNDNGIGDYFLSCLYSDIASLKVFGGMHAKPYKNFHRALSKLFPFAIYYTLHDDLVIIRAVIDCRKNPSWIRRHLKQV